MVYNSVKYVQIGKEDWSCNGLFISAHLIIMEKSTTTCSFMALLIFGDALKKSQRDLRGWDSRLISHLIHCHWPHTSSHATNNLKKNQQELWIETLVCLPKWLQRLKEFRVCRLDGAAQSSSRCIMSMLHWGFQGCGSHFRHEVANVVMMIIPVKLKTNPTCVISQVKG